MLLNGSGSLTVSLYERMLDQITEGVLLVEVGGGFATTVYANLPMEAITGYERAELLGEAPVCLSSDHLPPHVKQDLLTHLEHLQPFTYEVLCPHKSGPMYWSKVHWSVLEEGVWMVRHQDITEQQHLLQAHQVQQHHLNQLLEHGDLVIRVMEGSGRTSFVTPTVERLLGYTVEEYARLTFQDYVHPEDLPGLLQAYHQQTQDTERIQFGPFEYRVFTRGGEEKWLSTVSRKVSSPEGHVFHVSSRDISLRKRTEVKLQEQLERFRNLLDLTLLIESVSEPDQLGVEVLTFLLPLTEYTFAAFLRALPDRVMLECSIGPDGERARDLIAGDLPGLTGEELASRVPSERPVFFSHLSEHFEPTRLGEFSPSLAVLPLWSEGKLCGLFLLGAPEAVEVSVATRRLCTAVTDRVSLAYSRLLDVEKLQLAREETLRAMGLVLEYRDYETKGHTDRVTGLSLQLGHLLGLSETELEDLRLGAYLHDVGKVAIPDQVLLKPGKLTEEEWGFIKEHPLVGFELLHHIPTLNRNVLDVVLHHQERWNGSGYPAGLAGEEIPLLARIFAVVDVFDALTSERPYKRAWTAMEALEQLQREGGTLLDPAVVKAFVELHRKEN